MCYHKKTLQEGTLKLNVLGSCFNHNNLDVAEARVMYLALDDDLDTIVCFLDFQTTKDSPMKIQNQVVDFLVVMQLPQSASE